MLAFSRFIDSMNTWIGKFFSYAVLFSIFISAINAVVRKFFDSSSNGFLEVQWVLFGAAWLFAAPWVLLLNEHIRIDILNTRFKPKTRIWIDIIGHGFVLIPFCLIVVYFAVPWAYNSYLINEQSENWGGLPQWWSKIMIPPAFFLLFLQGVSELIKRIAVLRGVMKDPHEHSDTHGTGEMVFSQDADEDSAIEAMETAQAGVSPRWKLFFRVVLGVVIVAAVYFGITNYLEMREAAGGSLSILSWLHHNLAPIMFAIMVGALLLGYPTAFTLAGVGMLIALVGFAFGDFNFGFYGLMPPRIYGVMKSDLLLAVPFFTFMGLILERSGMAEDLLDTIGNLFGTVRGGLAYAVILVGALLAATTGVVAASVIAMGLISLPIMMRYGYDRQLATGVITSSGTLAQIVPPSLVLIIMADQLGRSPGDMYTAAFVPAFMIIGAYLAWVFIYSMLRPNAAPGLPAEAIAYRKKDGGRGLLSLFVMALLTLLLAWGLTQSMGANFLAVMRREAVDALGKDEYVVIFLMFWMSAMLAVAILDVVAGKILGRNFLSPIARATAFVLVPPLFLIFLVLGTIIIGIATPTEGGAMGAVGALALAGIKRIVSRDKARLNFGIVHEALLRTTKLSAFVLFILVGSRLFTLTFFGVEGDKWVEAILTGVTGNQVTFLILISIVVFILGCFLDFFEIAFITVPLLLPAAEALGIDLVWLGIVLSINLQTSFLTPPFGFALVYMRSVARKDSYEDPVTGARIEPIRTGEIFRGVVPFVVIQAIMILVVIFFPQTVMHYKGSAIQVDEEDVQNQLDGFSDDLNIELDLPSFE